MDSEGDSFTLRSVNTSCSTVTRVQYVRVLKLKLSFWVFDFLDVVKVN